MFLIRNSPLLLIKSQTKSTLLKNKIQASPNDRFGIIGDYIVDFLFRRSRLIVEIDGGYHFTDEQQLYDTIRQEWLENQGFKVIRFTNQEVLFNPDYVITKIKQTL